MHSAGRAPSFRAKEVAIVRGSKGLVHVTLKGSARRDPRGIV